MILGVVQFRRQRHQDALDSWQHALDIQRRALDPGDPALIGTRVNMAEALVALRRHEQALAALDAIPAATGASAGQVPALRALVHKIRGQALLGQGRHGAARAELEAALALLRAQPDPSLELADVLWALARARRQGGRRSGDDARALAREAGALYRSHGHDAVGDEIDDWLAR